MEAILIILYIYLLLYLWSIIRLYIGYGKVAEFAKISGDPLTTFSIVVPFRDESGNIPNLLESVANLNYPRTLFEVILIDDGSRDDGQSLIYRWRMQNGSLHATLLENIRRSGSPKKDAIARAIPIATGDWIVTTDADCRLPENWLGALDAYIRESGCRMVSGPVKYQVSEGIVGVFQKYDLLAMQGATIGGFGLARPFMCNGANFAYEKKLFHELDGFAGNDDKPGGDDVFLLHKAVDAGACTGYIKSRDAIIITNTEKSWKNLFWQRVRWASKASAYQSDFAENISLAVLFGNVSLLFLGILACFQIIGFWFFVIPFVLKIAIDMLIMVGANRFLKQQKFVFPIFSSIFYPVFSFVVAIFALRGKYRWKGREWG